MTAFSLRTTLSDSPGLRKWISRAFIVSILVYLVVIAYLIAESVTGASRWAPYGVNIPVFIALIIASEVAVTATAVWIFREDSGIWPDTIATGWREMRSGRLLQGLGRLLDGAWNVSIIDLRLRSRTAIALGRINRIAAVVPLAYALAASAGSPTPLGLRSSAILDVAITLAVWAFMELVMVRPDAAAPASGRPLAAQASRDGASATARDTAKARAPRHSVYQVRRITRADIGRLSEIEALKWGGQAATQELIERRISTYPQGQVGAVHSTVIDGRTVRSSLAAWITVMAAREAQVRSFTSWDAVTANGTIATCDPKGDVLVGVNLTSVTQGATYMLVGEMLASVVAWGKQKFIGGARLNGFVAFNEHRAGEGRRPLTADEYANLRELRGHRINERRLDYGLAPLSDEAYVALVDRMRAVGGEPPRAPHERPDYVCSNLRGYMSIPGAHMVAVVPDYFRDASSDDWGVVIDWTNPLPPWLRQLPGVRHFAAGRVRSAVRAEWEERKRRLHAPRAPRTTAAREPSPASPTAEREAVAV